eukprot:m.279469 g.279469  ORF g.279469 m.279469 type:complete len:59 (+) comp40624_c0_seq14:367-543(+)
MLSTYIFVIHFYTSEFVDFPYCLTFCGMPAKTEFYQSAGMPLKAEWFSQKNGKPTTQT